MHTTIRQLLLVSAIACATTSARGDDTYDVSWHTIDCGGGIASGGSFSLAGTIGQADAAVMVTGGGFDLTGGFWAGMTVNDCFGDLDNDEVVTASDLAYLLGAWGTADPIADLDSSGIVGASDLAILLGAWGPC